MSGAYFHAMRTTVRLPEALLRQAKMKAAEQGCTLTAIIEEGLRAVLNGPPSSGRKKRTMPRVSRASGGLVSGVVWDQISDVTAKEEIEDLHRSERSR